MKKTTLFYALLFVLPLYNVWFFEFLLQIEIPLWINSCFAPISLYILLTIPKTQKFYFGFIVGVLWFYWISWSFYYFDFTFLIPFIVVFVACVYMLVFACILWFENPFYRGIMLTLSSLIHPFGFDWFNIDSFFAYSYFGVDKLHFLLCVFSMIALVLFLSSKHKIFLLCIPISLIFALDFSSFTQTNQSLPFKAQITQTNFSQNIKWQKQHIIDNTNQQINTIQKAILAQQEIIIFPETTLPFILEKTPYFKILKNLSHQITIVIGSLQEKRHQTYNSTYIFQNGKVNVFNKVILAPFGEKIPLPDSLAQPLGKLFWGEESVLLSASEEFGYFTHNNTKIKSAICYEGTSQRAYADNPKYMIVISNNAWFPHSIEPALQKNLMKYYARLYHTTILHSSNGSNSFIIFP